MSEKKTSEIKLRIEPSVKAQWQHLAAEEEIGLSEWLTKAAEERGRNQRIAELAERGIPVVPDETYRQWHEPESYTATGYKFSSTWKPWDDAA